MGDSGYFDPWPAGFMTNDRVRDLQRMLARLGDAGVEVDDRDEESEHGRFGWAMDPEGNGVEPWRAPPGR